MPKNKLLGAAALVAAIAGGAVTGALLGVPAVTAAQEGDEPTTTVQTDDHGDDQTDDQTDDEAGTSDDRFGKAGPFCGPGSWRIRAFFGAHLSAAAALGISEEELGDALRDGDTIAEVAEANDVDVQDVVDTLVAKATAAIDEAVGEENLDAERAEEIKADLAERVTAHVNGEHPAGGGPGHGPGFGAGSHPGGPTS